MKSTHPLEIVKRLGHAKGFVVLPKRWIIERTLASAWPLRRLAKDLGMPQPQGACLPPPRLHPPHAAKALQSSMMFPDKLYRAERRLGAWLEQPLARRAGLGRVSHGLQKHNESDSGHRKHERGRSIPGPIANDASGERRDGVRQTLQEPQMTIPVALVAKSMHGDRVEQRRERCLQQILNRDCSRHERQRQPPDKEYGGGRCDQDCPLQSASAPEHDITDLTPYRSGDDNGCRSDRKEESDALRRKPAAGENWRHKRQKHASGGPVARNGARSSRILVAMTSTKGHRLGPGVDRRAWRPEPRRLMRSSPAVWGAQGCEQRQEFFPR